MAGQPRSALFPRQKKEKKKNRKLGVLDSKLIFVSSPYPPVVDVNFVSRTKSESRFGFVMLLSRDIIFV
jgi:hypothetical protein